ncbi:AAC(3) family N-acetyltransferase [Paenibacillus macquariensis]|uniref:Aminoglycoside N(3)-acetyltransferase n=1 Tax=Paenibacillus macquariensis TaxID=948756 RepID=A0ABY1JJR7_9BACL|nr:AAC(3) family N-acetyltransferase [Paenibacillus macquariensis]MEC0089712.1 AAC(3) family N-acetyltransferase [Paenibacillus macquariensis]OAB30809.1 AAC(3) family N-acetyltransferase [Paenibacillus macquariensis subsp. macquariensis]SIQ29385.1 aminoglycoside 3-N-acetyltransferase [Paenibacillus macquariensis]
MTVTNETRVILTKADLIQQFITCGVAEGQTIFVHTSLKSLGFVVGGAETLIRSLLEIVGEEGTLMMPSQTWKNLDPSTGVHWEEPVEWWPIIREHWPAYDKEITPAISMGIVAEMFRSWPGAYRSDHPARSIAAVGKHAEYITSEHDLSNIFGINSPVDKLYTLDGYVLLIGVGYDKNTSLHLAETRAHFATKRFTDESSAIMVDGKRQWVTYSTQAVDDEDFIRLGSVYDTENNIVVHKVGNADVRFMKQRPLIDWTVQWMERNRV